MLAVIVCGLWLGGVLAEGGESAARVQHAVTEIEPPHDRRLELKRALVGVSELPSTADGRRRLTADEREALTRELREAMDGVYETRRRERQRSQ